MHVCHALLYNFIMNEKNVNHTAKHNQRATIKHSALRYCTEAPPGSAGPPDHDVVLMPDHAGAPALAATAGGKNAGPQGCAHTVTPAHTGATTPGRGSVPTPAAMAPTMVTPAPAALAHLPRFVRIL